MSGRTRLVVELTEGAFRVSSGEKRLTIYTVKDLPNIEEPADFVIRLDEILTWDPPHEDEDRRRRFAADRRRDNGGMRSARAFRGLRIAAHLEFRSQSRVFLSAISR